MEIINKDINNLFDNIKADNNLKEKTLNNILSNNNKKNIWITLVPSLVIILLFIYFGVSYFKPISYISIDINPSIELVVNKYDRVIKVNALNKDASNVIKDLNLLNINYITAIEELEQSNNFKEYNDSYTEITVVSTNENKQNQMLENISNCSINGDNVSYYYINEEIRKEAEKYNISFGKYRAYLELKELNNDITIEDIRYLSMKEIEELFNQDINNNSNNNSNQNNGKNKYQYQKNK